MSVDPAQSVSVCACHSTFVHSHSIACSFNLVVECLRRDGQLFGEPVGAAIQTGCRRFF